MHEPRLEVVDTLGRRIVVINKPSFSIGRRSANDLRLTGTDVSREHADILLADGRYLIRDRGSRCGTMVNGTVITERPLKHGDRIRIGRTAGAELVFLIDDTPASEINSGTSIVGGFRQVAALLEALRALGSSRVLDEVLLLVMDAAIDVTGAERGFIMLANDAGELELKLARLQGRISLSGARFETSRKIPEQVFASGQPRIVADLRDGDLASAHGGTIALGIRHVMCVPLRLVRYVDAPGTSPEARAIGVLYLDSREKGRLLSDAAATALETLAGEASVAIENARLYREAAEKARTDQELRIASQIQQALLPQARKNVGFCEAMGASIPCRAIGGDFFEYLDLPDGSFGFALGDVSGKGPPAALLTAVLQGIFAAQAFALVEPNETLRRVNRALLARGVESRFATIFFGVITPDGRLTYCNAGHNPPLLLTGGHVRKLETGGMIVGLFPHATYDQETVQLSAGNLLAVFSDGVSEALSASGEEFGEDRILTAITADNCESTGAALQSLLSAVKSFAEGAPQNDDVTAMVVKYLG
jgi:serine phosphatase RsbU (regulator of sigma subunit)/pSer/pThr/pTyr-binding forkhead associated (FHA) protein